MMRMSWMLVLVGVTGCDGGVANPTEPNANEVVTTVELTIDGTVYTWTDPENDGDPVIDTIVLPVDSALPVTVRFENGLEDPPEDITVEVEEESDEHQVFFGVSGNLSYAYGDTDANGLPVGLSGTLTTGAAETATLRVVLRHLPEESGQAVKIDGLADDFAADGTNGLPGDSDADVEFPVTVE